MAKPIKLGVIGWGGRGEGIVMTLLHEHAKHLFEITAVADLYQGRRERAMQSLGLSASAVYPNHTELLKHADVEAVMVETGSPALAPICCEALRAGKHAIADVPMIDSRKDCWDLVVAAEQSGKVYCMGEQVRFANFVDKWRQHIRNGDIGEPLFVQGEYIHPEAGFYFDRIDTGDHDFTTIEAVANDPNYEKTWRNHFRDPIRYIPHELSPLLKIVEDRVTKVSCAIGGSQMYGDAVEMLDLECAVMQTAKGRALRIVNSFTAPRGGSFFHHWYHIMGTDGVLENSRAGWGVGGEIILRKDGRVEKTDYGWPPEQMPFGDASVGHAGLEAYVFKQFHDAIQEGAPTELDVYTMADVALPGAVAAESATAGGVLLDVPDVRPSAERPAGTYPKLG
jgi:predicted dehydrogenase